MQRDLKNPVFVCMHVVIIFHVNSSFSCLYVLDVRILVLKLRT